MGNVYIHRSGLPVEIEAPGFLQDLFPAEDQSAVGCKGEEQVEFLGTQVNDLGIEPDFASCWINGQVADMDRFGGI